MSSAAARPELAFPVEPARQCTALPDRVRRPCKRTSQRLRGDRIRQAAPKRPSVQRVLGTRSIFRELDDIRPIPDDVADHLWQSARAPCPMAGRCRRARCGPGWQDNGRRALREKVPQRMLELLKRYAAALRPTYGTAAQCLLTWVGDTKSKWIGK
jgi:hypothetical protein